MCLSGRCSMCQHKAIELGVNHHDLQAVNKAVSKSYQNTDGGSVETTPVVNQVNEAD